MRVFRCGSSPGGLHPDHDTLANFRKTFLGEIKGLFVQILLLAQAAGVHQLGNMSLDGSKIRADASESHAVAQREVGRYKCLLELETELRQEVHDLFTLGGQVDQGECQPPEELVLEDELAIRQARLRLVSLAQAKAVLDAHQGFSNGLIR